MTKTRDKDTFSEYYNQLNKEQKKAVDALDGPLLVLAGPGTGKTQLLSVRAANIVRKKKASPENILILTYTNAAAGAMRERLARIIGDDGYDVVVETFHGFANSVILESEGAIDFIKDRIPLEDVDKVRAIQHILDSEKGAMELRPFGSPYIHRNEIESRISELKNEGISPGEFKTEVKGLKPYGDVLEDKDITRLKALSVIYEEYEKLKVGGKAGLFDERGRYDTDDMILIALEALKSEKELRDSFRREFKYIMVDEYQDTNGAQLELLFSVLDSDNPNLCCVGDDDQAIYRFQGATLSNFRTLKKRLSDVKTISLINNYRSTGDITDVSGRIIAQLPEEERMDVKKLKSCRDYDKRDIRFFEFGTEEEELAFIVDEVKKQAEVIKKDTSLSDEEREKPYNNIAILVRKRKQILKVIDAFLKAGVPYSTDGKEDIRSERRVRQVLDVLKLTSIDTETIEEKSLSLYRILTSDYIEAEHSDVLKFVHFINLENKSSGRSSSGRFDKLNLFQQFQEHFAKFTKDADGLSKRPDRADSEALPIAKKIGLKNPHAFHVAAWAIERLLSDSDSRPVHDMLMRYVDDTRLYNFILKRYECDKVLRIRDLRSLVSFINRVKQADLGRPGLRLKEFMDELDLMEMSNMPLRGSLATLSQDGVSIYTAHGSKGREFYSVFLPFCLQGKSWPSRGKSDVISIPPDIFKSKERVEEKEKRKDLDRYDELRLFYVASSRAKSHLFYTATPTDKTIVSPFMNHLGVAPEEGAPKDEEEFLIKLLDKSGEHDPFTGTEDVLKDIVRDLTLNPTSLNNYIKCHRKFLYDNVLMLPGRKKQQLVFGNCAHKALEDVYTIYMEKEKFPPFSEFKKSFMKDLAFQGVSEAIKSSCVDKLERVKDWYRKEEKFPVMPLDLENKLEVTLPGGIVFRGTFDKIERQAEGEIKVVDYKTGKPDKHVKKIANCQDLESYDCDDYFRQLIAYKMLYERYYRGKKKDSVTKGVLQFLDPVGAGVKKYGLEKGAYRNEEVDLTDRMVEELEDVIRKCWSDIQDLKFEKLEERDDRERCKFCDFDSICWGS